MKKLILVAALTGCMAVQGFAQIDTIVLINETFTIPSHTPAPDGATYQWMVNGTVIDGATDASYTGSLPTEGLYMFIRQAKNDVICTDWMSSNPFVIEVSRRYQNQGGCTFTQPPVVGTFATFPSTYSAATYVTLEDERDGNNYTVAKIGDYWIMAQNLNYQKGLTWVASAAEPSTVTTSPNQDLIGHFWCPGPTSTTISSRVSCDVWGAFYSWETAMIADGTGTWEEVAVYNTGAANLDNSKYNHGRNDHSGTVTGGRGICPPNWHVPTDFEWGQIFDAMESTGGTRHQTASGQAAYGADAGKRAKAACSCLAGDATETNTCWENLSSSYDGIDAYGMRFLSNGGRLTTLVYLQLGIESYDWSSSARNVNEAWDRNVNYNRNTVHRRYHARSQGFGVRCILDQAASANGN
jgi:uncharacterized protein (TIGR02145 family)